MDYVNKPNKLFEFREDEKHPKHGFKLFEQIYVQRYKKDLQKMRQLKEDDDKFNRMIAELKIALYENEKLLAEKIRALKDNKGIGASQNPAPSFQKRLSQPKQFAANVQLTSSSSKRIYTIIQLRPFLPPPPYTHTHTQT